MKVVFLILVILISYMGFKLHIPPIPLLTLYGFIVFLPVIFIIVKKNMVNALLAWFFFVLFRYGLWKYGVGKIALPLLPDISIDRIIWIALFFTFLTGIALNQLKLDVKITRIEITMFILCLYILGSMIVAGTFYKKGQGLFLNTFLQTFFFPFSIFIFAKNIINDEQKIKKVLMFFSIMGFYLGFTGICEYLNWNFLVFPKYIIDPLVGVHYGKARGPLLDAGVNGVLLGECLFITIYLLIHSSSTKMKIFHIITIIFILTALIFTFNRSSWIGVSFASLILFTFYPKSRKFIIAGLLILGILTILLQTGVLKTGKEITSLKTFHHRLVHYAAALRMFADKPFFGFGYNNAKKFQAKYFKRIEGIPYKYGKGSERYITIHNVFLTMVVELGLIGFSLFIFILFFILRISIKLYQQIPSELTAYKGLVIIFWAIFIVFFVKIQFSEIRFFMLPTALVFGMAGIIDGLYQRVLLKSEVDIKTKKKLFNSIDLTDQIIITR